MWNSHGVTKWVADWTVKYVANQGPFTYNHQKKKKVAHIIYFWQHDLDQNCTGEKRTLFLLNWAKWGNDFFCDCRCHWSHSNQLWKIKRAHLSDTVKIELTCHQTIWYALIKEDFHLCRTQIREPSYFGSYRSIQQTVYKSTSSEPSFFASYRSILLPV